MLINMTKKRAILKKMKERTQTTLPKNYESLNWWDLHVRLTN